MNRDNGKRDNRGRRDFRNSRDSVRRDSRPHHDNAEKHTAAVDERVPSDDRLEGRNSVLEALKAGREFNKIWVLELTGGRKPDPVLVRILNEAEKRKIPVVRTKREALDRMSETHNHQGVIAQVASHEYADIEDMIAKCQEEDRRPFFVVLDELKEELSVHSNVYIYMYAYVCVYTCVHMCICVHTCAFMHMCTHAHINIYICKCILIMEKHLNMKFVSAF